MNLQGHLFAEGHPQQRFLVQVYAWSCDHLGGTGVWAMGGVGLVRYTRVWKSIA